MNHNTDFMPVSCDQPTPFHKAKGDMLLDRGSWFYSVPNLIAETTLPSLTDEVQQTVDVALEMLASTADTAQRLCEPLVIAEALDSSGIEGIYTTFRELSCAVLGATPAEGGTASTFKKSCSSCKRASRWIGWFLFRRGCMPDAGYHLRRSRYTCRGIPQAG